jgi:hypothetical protein
VSQDERSHRRRRSTPSIGEKAHIPELVPYIVPLCSSRKVFRDSRGLQVDDDRVQTLPHLTMWANLFRHSAAWGAP